MTIVEESNNGRSMRRTIKGFNVIRNKQNTQEIENKSFKLQIIITNFEVWLEDKKAFFVDNVLFFKLKNMFFLHN